MADFVHLHVHSQYSLLDGAASINQLVQEAAASGAPALALTDHGVMYGALKFYQAAEKAGIKPILGCEVYVARRTRHDKQPKIDEDSFHLVLLAENEEGYKNLLQLVSLSHVEGFYYRPRVDKEILAAHTKGLIALSACLSGEIPYYLTNNQPDAAWQAAVWYKETFGAENFFLELQDQGLAGQKQLNRSLVEIGTKLGVGLVATNDLHYMRREDARVHDVLLCIQTGKNLNDQDRMRFPTNEFYFKSGEEMGRLFAETPAALANTLAIAERCNVRLKLGEYHLPDFAVPAGMDTASYLEHLCREGMKKRFKVVTPEIKARLEHELSVIKETGFPGYFLIVADFVRFAKGRGIMVGPGRGSGAGSLVGYLLGITELDPLKYDLLFERFLNPERVSMPDFDIDFCYERRGEVIEYVKEKYGRDHVAQIITFGTMAARGAVRDVGRVLGFPYGEVDRLAKLIPNELGITLEEAIKSSPELQTAISGDQRIADLFAIAQALEGVPRHASIHAAGVVISKEPLTNHVPLARAAEGEFTTQFPMEDLETIGLLKMDFLGLRTLTVLQQTIELVKAYSGDEIDLSALPEDDPKTMELLCSGETLGIFQLESAGMRRLLMQLAPTSFTDLIPLVALYRPGPLGSGMAEDFIKRRHGEKNITYLHPDLEEILRPTYGIILYQEQVMQICSKLGGFSLGEADLVRRAMGKKKPEVLAAMRRKFLDGAAARGISQRIGEEIFDLMEHFAGYGFNKSHSAAYALIAYWTAFLKANYPQAFLAALLTSVIGDSDKVGLYIEECRRLGIPVYPPDVNHSSARFTVEGRGIRFGLLAVKNMGVGVIQAIEKEREKTGFASFYDFCQRLESGTINKRVVESLIKAGAFTFTGRSRRELLDVYEHACDQAHQRAASRRGGQLSFFDLEAEFAAAGEERWTGAEEFPLATILALEKEYLGVYLSGHPIDPWREKFKENHIPTLAQILEKGKENGAAVDTVLAGGVVSRWRRINTKAGKTMASFVLEDPTGSLEVLVFPNLYERVAAEAENDRIVVVKGRLDEAEEGEKLLAQQIRWLPRHD